MSNLKRNIIGNGFIAKKFNNYKSFLKKKNYCIYAAGVSNSSLKNKKQFLRDYYKVKKFIKYKHNNKLVYISTCTIFDPNRKKTQYIKNKIKIENFIKKNSNNYLIIRFPEIIGYNKNKYTLINYFYNHIRNNKKFKVFINAKRNLVNIDDAIKLTLYFLKHNSTLKEINIANLIYSSPIKIINILENLLKKKSICEFDFKKVKKWKIDNSVNKNILNKIKIKFNSHYLKNSLKKYYKK